MLRIIQNSHAEGAKSYYSSADYYMEGQELTGRWRGKAAAMLGLKGDIQKADWDAICDQVRPTDGEPLFQRRKANRTIGYDFNFHVPKSVSALYALSNDDRILEAFKASVDSTMHDIEAEMQTRVRKEGRNEDRVTGNMVRGEFVHLTSRPVDGVPDPHLHAHSFVHNLTWDAEEQAWKAGQFRSLKRDAPYFEAMFHARLSRRLAELGLPIERTQKGWEIEGVPRTVVDKFSRRTAEIEEKARELGIEDAEAKDEPQDVGAARRVAQPTHAGGAGRDGAGRKAAGRRPPARRCQCGSPRRGICNRPRIRAPIGRAGAGVAGDRAQTRRGTGDRGTSAARNGGQEAAGAGSAGQADGDDARCAG
jgi:conjugative relaxase-like TrwC/TraI family protein